MYYLLWRICFNLQPTSVFPRLLIFNRHLNSVRFCIYFFLLLFEIRTACNVHCIHEQLMQFMMLHGIECNVFFAHSKSCFRSFFFFLFFISVHSVALCLCKLVLFHIARMYDVHVHIFLFRKANEWRWENCSNFAECKCHNHFFDDCTVCRANVLCIFNKSGFNW